MDIDTLNILAKKASGANVTIYTTKRGDSLSCADIEKFNAQYPELKVKHTEAFHDRFLLLDSQISNENMQGIKSEAYLIGASLKDAGKKCFAVARIEDEKSIAELIERLNKDVNF